LVRNCKDTTNKAELIALRELKQLELQKLQVQMSDCDAMIEKVQAIVD
jgi:hypothetical protein